MQVPSVASPSGVELLEELGRGVHSVVYRARRQSRYYAVKVPLSSDETQLPKVARAFLREATALARVRHPALPMVMEVGSNEGVPFLVMELVAGETLATRLQKGALGEEQVLDIASRLAEALICIHRSGLVHHDVSVANVLFDTHTDAVRLIDFGFVQQTPISGPASGKMCGPDLVNLSGPEIDLFGLGGVLFECVTAMTPFSAVDPRPLLERSGDNKHLPPHISRGFAVVLRRLLRLEEAHYVDASQVMHDLRGLIERRTSPEHLSSSFGARLAKDSPVALVGRGREIDRLRQAWRASRARQGQIVLVRGSSGTGKTRLLDAFLDEVSHETQTCHVYACAAEQREPFAWVRKLVHSHLARLEKLPERDRRAALEQFREFAGDAAPLLCVLSARLARVFEKTVPAPRGDGAEEIFAEGLADFLVKLLNQTAATTIVIDDVQWLDPGSRQVLSRFTDAEGSRTLLLLGARDDDESWEHVGRLMRSMSPERVWELPLEPLDDDRISELIDAYLGRQPYDVDLLRFVSSVSDRTPLGVLEMSRALLEGGAVTPFWGKWKFDAAKASSLGIPRGARELLSRRVQELNSGTKEVLSAAAVLAGSFDVALLADVSKCTPESVQVAVAEAREGLLVEGTPGSVRFMHDAVREVLMNQMPDAMRRRLHRQAAIAFHARLNAAKPDAAKAAPSTTPPSLREVSPMTLVYEVARHFSLASVEGSEPVVIDSCIAAGRLAFQSYDNELALKYLDHAKREAERLGSELPLDVITLLAEAHLRTGDVRTSVSLFWDVVHKTDASITRAQTLSRIVFAHQHHARENAWLALSKAFEELGVRPPSGRVTGLLVGLLCWVRWALFPYYRQPTEERSKVLEVLCVLYFQAARLASYDSRPSHIVEVTLRGLVPAEELGSPAARCKSYLLYGFVLTVLGATRRGRHYLPKAEALAKASADPVVFAHALQMQAMTLAWAGDILGAVRVGNRSLTEYGRWRELSEFCITAYNSQQIDALRGRNLEAWKWLQLALARLTKNDRPPVTLEFIEDSARAALVALGRSRETEAILGRLADTARREASRAIASVPNHGSDIRLFTESGRLDDDFEALVQEIEGKNYDPRRVHLEMTEYYVHVAHARVHACLRATPDELYGKVRILKRALSDAQKAARIPLLKAHALVIEGYMAFFEKQHERALKLFREAEALGQQEAAPWILYAVHRGRAHLERVKGQLEAAQDQARLAEALAKEHGAAYRLRWIREEFELRVPMHAGFQSFSYASGGLATSSGLEPHGTRPRAYLRSLVRIDRQTDLGRNQQGKVVLDELIETMSAERGFLFLASDWPEPEEGSPPQSSQRLRASMVAPDSLAPDSLAPDSLAPDSLAPSSLAPGSLPPSSLAPIQQVKKRELALVAARRSRGIDIEATDFDSALVEDLFLVGESEVDDGLTPGAATVAFFDERAIVAVPLLMRGQRVGVVYLDRPRRVWPFSEKERETLGVLADQIPLVFELGYSLLARDRAEQRQRSLEKLEAIGRLAGGIAHDFNNMLSVISSSTNEILSTKPGATIIEETKTIETAAARARELTRQLLTFARGQYVKPELIDMNQAVVRQEGIFKRLIGSSRLEYDLARDLFPVQADPSQIDQVLTNLVVNAGDAMSRPGLLRIKTRNTRIIENREDPGGLPSGEYVRIEVSDTGEGMDEATLGKAFEPFFTTKSNRSGTGLGLATAYGIITHSGGYIRVKSKRGSGTTFSIFLPAILDETVAAPPEPVKSRPPGKCTILVVDDEPLVRKATCRLVKSLGHEVLQAHSGEHALKLASEHLDDLDLVLTDVVMPEMNGLDVARELSRLNPSLKVLFMSGFTDGVLAERGVLNPGVLYIQKPIERDALAHVLDATLGTETVTQQ